MEFYFPPLADFHKQSFFDKFKDKELFKILHFYRFYKPN